MQLKDEKEKELYISVGRYESTTAVQSKGKTTTIIKGCIINREDDC